MKIKMFVPILFYTLTSFSINFSEYETKLKHIIEKEPTEWDENVKGVKTNLKTQEKIVALTLDACGSRRDSLDNRIIDFLIQKKIPTTFFITYQWIKKHPSHFEKLKQYSFFDIQNHGLSHRPCSINGKSQYGIQGTKNIQELLEEVELSAINIQKLLGKKPKFYRSGTAYYDEVAVEVVNALGYEVVGFDILGDKGATYSKEQVIEAFSKVKPGSIIIAHANRPERQSGAGIPEAIEKLLNDGYRFVKLADYELE